MNTLRRLPILAIAIPAIAAIIPQSGFAERDPSINKPGGLYKGNASSNFIYPSPPGLPNNWFVSSNAALRIPNRKGRIEGAVLTTRNNPPFRTATDIPIRGRATRIFYRRGKIKAIYTGRWSWNLAAYTGSSSPARGPFRIVIIKSFGRYKTNPPVRVNLKGTGPQPYSYRGTLNFWKRGPAD